MNGIRDPKDSLTFLPWTRKGVLTELQSAFWPQKSWEINSYGFEVSESMVLYSWQPGWNKFLKWVLTPIALRSIIYSAFTAFWSLDSTGVRHRWHSSQSFLTLIPIVPLIPPTTISLALSMISATDFLRGVSLAPSDLLGWVLQRRQRCLTSNWACPNPASHPAAWEPSELFLALQSCPQGQAGVPWRTGPTIANLFPLALLCVLSNSQNQPLEHFIKIFTEHKSSRQGHFSIYYISVWFQVN